MCEHAARAGNARLVEKATVFMGAAYVFGATPVEQALAWFEANAELVARHGPMLGQKAVLTAMKGEFVPARLLCEEARSRSLELGQVIFVASSAMPQAHVE